MIDSTILSVPTRETAATASRAARRPALAYVGAWVLGLALLPGGVTSADDARTVASHYATHRPAALAQIALVHAVAGVCLLAFARRVAEHPAAVHRRRIRRSATVAAALSWVQAAIGTAMILTAGHVAPGTTRAVLIGIERMDAVKLAALALLCAAAPSLARAGVSPRWTGPVGVAAAALLGVAAVGLVGVATLAPVAAPALVLLLAWVGGATFGRGAGA